MVRTLSMTMIEKHTSKLIPKYLQDKDIKVLPWLLQFENLRGELKRCVSTRKK